MEKLRYVSRGGLRFYVADAGTGGGGSGAVRALLGRR